MNYLYDQNTSPWGPGFTHDFKIISTGDRTPQELAKEVTEALIAEEREGEADVKELVDFSDMLREAPPGAGPALLQNEGEREPLWRGSPVQADHGLK